MRKQNFERTMRHLFLRTVILLELLLEPLDGFLQMLTMYHSTPSPRTALTASMHHPLLSHANQCLPLKYHWRQLLPRLRRRESIVCFLALPSGSGRAVDMLGGNAADALNASTAAGEDYDTPCESQDSTDGAQTEFLAPHEGLDTTSEASDARNAAQKKSNAFTPYGERETVEELSSVCRIVAEGDGKLAVESLSPSFANSPMLDRINAIFQASILSKTSHLHVNPTISSISREIDHAARRGINAKIELEVDIAIDSCFSDDAVEERQLPTVMRNSLESAGL